MVKVNGESLDIAGKTLSDFLLAAGYNEKRIAVELNGAIVPKSKYSETVFKDGDSAEVVSFVGGG